MLKWYIGKVCDLRCNSLQMRPCVRASHPAEARVKIRAEVKRRTNKRFAVYAIREV